MYTLLLAVIYLAFISLGLPDSLLGAGWPVMHTFFGVPLSAAGVVSMTISGCTVISSLASERMTRRFGTSRVTLASVLLTAAALLGFSCSGTFLQVCLWAVPYGLGAGSIDAALNNYVALHYTSRHMSWLHCFWGVGTIVSPYIMSWALTHASWQTGYRTVSVIQFAIALALAASLPLWRIHRAPASPEGSGAKPVGLAGALRIRGVAQVLLGFFCYCAAEATCMLWTASYLIGTRGVSAERAAAFASLFFIGITAGRFLSGLISDRVGDRGMIRLGAAVAAAGVCMTALTRLPVEAALAGCVVIGLGCAPIYPSIIHATPANFGADRSQAVIGMQMASAYTGSTFMPPLFGVLSARLGLQLMPAFVGLFLALTVILTEAGFRLAGQTRK